MNLTRDELKDLSGYRRPSSVRKWLQQNGFVFVVGVDGWPRVARSHYDHRMSANSSATLTRSSVNVAALMELQNGKKAKAKARPS